MISAIISFGCLTRQSRRGDGLKQGRGSVEPPRVMATCY
jgi:hypothetical protein